MVMIELHVHIDRGPPRHADAPEFASDPDEMVLTFASARDLEAVGLRR
jgi:hypothetical protein